jgi:hypothetical protein
VASGAASGIVLEVILSRKEVDKGGKMGRLGIKDSGSVEKFISQYRGPGGPAKPNSWIKRGELFLASRNTRLDLRSMTESD